MTPENLDEDLHKSAELEETRKKIQRLNEESHLNDMRTLLKMKEFRRFVWNLFEIGRLKKTCFSTDPLIMAALNARRDFATEIENTIRMADKKALMTMEDEHLKGEYNVRND